MNEVSTILKKDLSIKNTNVLIDAVEYVMINEMVASGEFELIQAPLKHIFTDGLYTRIITMPQNSRFTTFIHKTYHPFFVLKGKVSVFSDIDGTQLIEAPFVGVTKPGTRRVLHVHEETIWITTHRTDIKPKDNSEEAIQEAADLVINEITEYYENDLLGGRYVNSVFMGSEKIENTQYEK